MANECVYQRVGPRSGRCVVLQQDQKNLVAVVVAGTSELPAKSH